MTYPSAAGTRTGPVAGATAVTVPDPPTVQDRIAATVLAVDGVAGLHGGSFGEAATYLPGRRITGVRTGTDGTDVHVSVYFGTPVRETALLVQRAVSRVATGPVHVTIEDVLPAEPGAAPPLSPDVVTT